VNFVDIRRDHDLGPMRSPGRQMPQPALGYVVKGRLIVRHSEHEEVIDAGDALK
jgi:hypothetical protein